MYEERLLSQAGLSNLGPKWGRLSANSTKPGLFLIRFKYILAHRVKKYKKSYLKKSRICPILANLTHFGAKPDIPKGMKIEDARVVRF